MPSTEADALPPVLLRSALLTEGLTADEIQRSRRNGTWQTLARGAYCDAGIASSLSKEQQHRLRARALAIRSPHLVLSHLSAATVLRLPLWRPELEDVHLTRIGISGGRATPGRVVHRAVLAPSEIITVSGVRVTSMARTLVDIACTESMASAVMAADAALQRRWVSSPALTEALDATGHRRGAAAARRALRFADGRAESAGESMIRVTMQSLGLPPPTLQIRIYDPDGTFLGRVDLGYPELGVLFEFDGLVKYRKPFHRRRIPLRSSSKRRSGKTGSATWDLWWCALYGRTSQSPRPCSPRSRRLSPAGGRSSRIGGSPARGRQIPPSRSAADVCGADHAREHGFLHPDNP